MSSASLEPEETLDNCFSNQGFKAAMIGEECRCRAAIRVCGVIPRTVASMAYSLVNWRTAASAIGDLVLRASFTNLRRRWTQHWTSFHGPCGHSRRVSRSLTSWPILAISPQPHGHNARSG